MNKRIKLRDAGILIAVSILPILLVAATLLWWEIELEQQGQYNSHILSAARRYDVPKELIKAVIWRESRFRYDAHGAADERGLMQVTPAAGMDWAKHEKLQHFNPDKLFNPQTNIHAGTWYLSRALKRWKDADNPIPFALAEYNAGPVHARRWSKEIDSLQAAALLDVMDYPTTRQYILDISERMEIYRNTPSPDPIEFIKDKASLYWHKFVKNN
ncbi:MAG: transglycosylase SLT domain-containing protein [Verrucomicrobiota bacterium]